VQAAFADRVAAAGQKCRKLFPRKKTPSLVFQNELPSEIIEEAPSPSLVQQRGRALTRTPTPPPRQGQTPMFCLEAPAPHNAVGGGLVAAPGRQALCGMFLTVANTADGTRTQPSGGTSRFAARQNFKAEFFLVAVAVHLDDSLFEHYARP